MTQLERRIRLSGLLISTGITILLFSLLWKHPLSFMVFLAAGCPLILAGVVWYLYTLAAREGPGI